MAITDWASLRTAIQTKCARSDSTFTNEIERFVTQAESRIFHGVGTPTDPMYSEPVRVDAISTRGTIAVTSGIADVPTGCLEIRRLSRASDRIGLDYLSPDHFDVREAYNDGGNPRWYTVEGGKIRLAPGGYTGDLNSTYYVKPTGISSSNTTNAMLTAWPDLYYYATLIQAYDFMDANEQALKALAQYRSHASGVNATQIAVQHGGGKLTARPRRCLGV